jgi:hypothetical protein
MHISLKIFKTLYYSYSALHVSGTLAPIIGSLQILHIQPPVTVCRWVGCVLQLWSVTTVIADARNHEPEILKLYFLLCLGLGSVLFPPGFLSETLCLFLLSPSRPTSLHLIILITN